MGRSTREPKISDDDGPKLPIWTNRLKPHTDLSSAVLAHGPVGHRSDFYSVAKLSKLLEMSFTIVPLFTTGFPEDTPIPFGDGLVLQPVPDWLKSDPLLQHISSAERQSVLDAQHAFVAEYEATSIGHPDPSWTGTKPRSIQQSKYQSSMLANMALWLIQPSPLCFTLAFHAISRQFYQEKQTHHIIQSIDRHDPLFCHPRDAECRISLDQAIQAGQLHSRMLLVSRRGVIWTALRTLWAALTTYTSDVRYPLFWIALEALFGPNNSPTEITHKLAERIAFFTGNTSSEAQRIFRDVRDGYGMRSQIVHGRWKGENLVEVHMKNSEEHLRDSLLLLLADENLRDVFETKQRDKYLNELIFKKRFDTH